MVSLRFPFSSWFSPHSATPNFPSKPRRAIFTAAAAAAATTAAVAVTVKTIKQKHPDAENPVVDLILSNFCSSAASWASMSLSSGDSLTKTVVESKTGVEFPCVIKDSQTLLGIGLRRKCVFGLKNIDVYAFGVYADEDDVQKTLKGKYGKQSADELKVNKEFNEDILASDVNVTVRLQIVYSKLSIKSVRSAFEESVGSRLQKFGGSDNKELLERFTSQFKDELKIPKGSVIELSRHHGHVLQTIIDGQEVGNIQSKLLCQSVLDLYVGEDSFDQQAKESAMLKLANVFDKKNAPLG
ncbi:fatty-acid-binding protein 1 [Silene latifolia]|uniref:fatty-acid-binding protein 1 n=1 Tax=Silene latifolia TaxID=37657 RepID=UPI003D76AEB2